ncbi:MAG TPA: SDR family NAD(P)-dependent oxidoreductase [Casimicrobiaceae bacterium]
MSAKGTLPGQVAIVTGGAKGIGRGIGARLAQEGCRVVIWDREPEAFDASAAGFAPVAALRVDVGDLGSVEAGFAQTRERVERVDILVNNAGVNGPVAPVWDYPLEAWDRVLRVDLTGVFYCCRVVVPAMRAAGYGRVVNVSSITGKEGAPHIAAYAAAKAGVIGFTKSLAKELVGSGVLVNAIAPVITETDLFKEMTQAHIDAAKAKIPMGRFLTVEEIGAMVAWIASPECSFCTGVAFDLSGGRATY